MRIKRNFWEAAICSDRSMPVMDREDRRVMDNLREEYGKLARSLESALLSHAIRLCAGDVDWAKDVAQEALIKGYSAYRESRFGQDTNARAWLSRILVNVFINQYNRKRKWESGLDIEKLDPAAAPGIASSMEDLAFTGILEEPLQIALDALPEEQRICVLLIDIEQFEYSEAAKFLRVPVGTVRSRLARARLKLYSLLLPYAQSRRIV